MVDDGKIALTPAVELSYLTKPEQQDLRKYFPKSYSPAQMQDVILRLLEGYQRQRREQNRDSR